MRQSVGIMIAAVGLAVPAYIGAQPRALLAGTVIEPATGLPIPNVEVRVLGTDRLARSDSLGGFTLMLDAGRYLLRTTRLGFGPRSLSVELAAGDTITMAIDMMVLPIVLSEVKVQAREERYRGKMAAFAERMRTSTAPRSSFILRDEIERRHPPHLSNVLKERGGRVGECVGKANIYVDGAMLPPDKIGGPTRGRRTAPSDRDPRIDDFVSIDEVEAVEVYSGGADTPVEFLATAPRGLEPGCTILIWTR